MVVPLQWQARELGEGYAAVVVGVATLVVVAAALAARARWGPPESPESLVLVASMPVIVLGVALVGLRLEVGFELPDLILEREASMQMAIAWRRWGSATSLGLAASLLAASAVHLEARSRSQGARRIAALALLGAVFVYTAAIPAGWADRGGLQLPAALVEYLLESTLGRRVAASSAVGVFAVAMAIALVGRATSRRRALLASVSAAAAVWVVVLPEALRAEFPGFFCFGPRPGPASFTAMVLGAYESSLLAAAIMAAPILLLGGLRARRLDRVRGDVAVVGIVATMTIAPALCVLLLWEPAYHRLSSTSDPAVVHQEVEVLLPRRSGRPAWLQWMGGHDWPIAVIDRQGLRVEASRMSWGELRRPGGPGRLQELLPREERPAWQQDEAPHGARLYADHEVPVERIVELTRGARLDGFVLFVDAPTQPFRESLDVPEREVERLTVWLSEPGQAGDGRARLTLEGRQPRWLGPFDVLVDRPRPGLTLGGWLDEMHRAAKAADVDLVLLDPGRAQE